MTMMVRQSRHGSGVGSEHHHSPRASIGNNKASFVSPDKTVGSTPPNSPGNAGFDDDNNNINNFAATSGTNININKTNTRPTLPPPMGAPSPPTVERGNSPTGEGRGGCVGVGAGLRRKHDHAKNMLRVDKILCRVPSHESNISDLSASLSPNLPRGPPGVPNPNPVGNSPFVIPPPGSGSGGINNNNNNINNNINGIHHNNGSNMGTTRSSGASDRENILMSLMNECGVFDPVNDLLTVVGSSSRSVTSTRKHHAQNMHTSTTMCGTTCGRSSSTHGTVNTNNGCYETPAVWGIAPDEDDDEGTSTEDSSTMDYVSRNTASNHNHNHRNKDDSVEYDNVELVLDENTLNDDQHPPQAAADNSNRGPSPALSSNSATRRLKQLSNICPPSRSSGRKSPAAGILKNKLSSMSGSFNNSNNNKSPSTAIRNVRSGTTPPPGMVAGVAVVESKNDPRISHMYDITNFENEELRPSLGSNGGRSNSNSGNGNGNGRGVTPTSVPGSRGATPVSHDGSSAPLNKNNTASGRMSPYSTNSNRGLVSAGVDVGTSKASEEMFGQAVDNKKTGQLNAIPTMVDRAFDVAAGVFPTNEEVEVDNAPLIRKDGNNANNNSSSSSGDGKKAGRGRKLMKGLSFKPKSSKNSGKGDGKTLDDKNKSVKISGKGDGKAEKKSKSRRSLSPKKRSKSIVRLKRNSNKSNNNNTNADTNNSKDVFDSSKNTGSSTTINESIIEEAKKWKATFDQNSGKTYYYHTGTKEVRWDKPLGHDEANATDASSEVAVHLEAQGIQTGEDDDDEEDVKAVEAREKEDEVNDNVNGNKAGKRTKRGLSVGTLGRKGLKVKSTKKAEGDKASDANNTRGPDNNTATADIIQTAAKESEAKEAVKDDNAEAKYWRATLDATTNKTYYYNKKTKETSWTKPPGFGDGKDAGKSKDAEGTAEEAVGVGSLSVAEKRKKTWFKKKADNKTSPDKVDGKRVAEECLEDKGENDVEDVAKTATEGSNADEVDYSKYWRATPDPSTGKTYYFNKKTKMVTWTKPKGFKEKEPKRKTELLPVHEEEEPEMEELARSKTPVTEEEVRQMRARTPTPVPRAKTPVEEPDTIAGDAIAELQAELETEDSTIEGFGDEEVGYVEQASQSTPMARDDAPFDEPDTPFDEPFDEPRHTPSPKRAHFEQGKPHIQEDSFDEFEPVGADQPLYGRTKSMKSIDFDNNARQRTFASAMTEETRKAANTGHHGVNKDDSLTMGSTSLNNSSIACSEIFTPFSSNDNGNSSDVRDDALADEGQLPPGRRAFAKKLSNRYSGPMARKSARDNLPLPDLPVTPPRSKQNNASGILSRSRSGEGGNHYGKQVKNSGNCSEEEEEISYEEEREEDQWISDDEVSALSGIGNDNKNKNGRGGRGRGGSRNLSRDNRREEDKHHQKNARNPREEKSSSRRKESTSHHEQQPQSGNANEWTQQELDSFIAKNDWQSVSKYINEMRINKNKNKPDDLRKQPSISEIQQRIEYNRSLEQGLSNPKTRFGALSQMQHEELSSQNDDVSGRSPAVESESVWQSLSSASYESSDEESSESYRGRQDQSGSRHRQRRRSSSRGRRRQSSPKETLL